jgi:hypothetical protein
MLVPASHAGSDPSMIDRRSIRWSPFNGGTATLEATYMYVATLARMRAKLHDRIHWAYVYKSSRCPDG